MKYAWHEANCDECVGYIAQDDPIYFADGGKVCKACAEKMGLVCPRCEDQKKPGFQLCYDCNAKDSKTAVAPRKKADLI